MNEGPFENAPEINANGDEPEDDSIRPITARVRRRVWLEPQVRFWWSAAALILLGAVFVGARGLMEWREDNFLIDSGTQVMAIPFLEEGARLKGRPLLISNKVVLDYEYAGKKYRASGYLFDTGESFEAGKPTPIAIDPENPQKWTNRTEEIPLKSKLVGGLLLLIFGTAAGLASAVLARSYRRLWVFGELRSGRVLDHGQSSIAPRSAAVRCAIRQGKHERVVSVFIAHADNPPAVGESIELVTNEAGSRAIAVQNYA